MSLGIYNTFLSMTHRLMTPQIDELIGAVCSEVYDILSPGVLGDGLTPALFHDTVYTAFSAHWDRVPNEPVPARPTASVATQCHSPGSRASVPIPVTPVAVR